MFAWLAGLWHARLRRIDVQILWPSCVKAAREHHPDQWRAWALAAFATHAFQDRAWLALGDDLERRLDELAREPTGGREL